METASLNSDEIEISTDMVAKEVSKVTDVGGIPEETSDFDTSLVFRLQPKEESGEEESTSLWYSDSSAPMEWLMCEV